MMLTEQPEHLN